MTQDEVITGLIGAVIGISIAILIMDMRWEHHNTIVKQDCGQYNSKTGDFEWIKQESNNE